LSNVSEEFYQWLAVSDFDAQQFAITIADKFYMLLSVTLVHQQFKSLSLPQANRINYKVYIEPTKLIKYAI